MQQVRPSRGSQAERDGLWRSLHGADHAPTVERVETPELLTERQAVQRLAIGGIWRDAARSALKAGIAGRPVRVSNHLLYDAAAVQGALERMSPSCELRVRTSRPIFVARVAPRTPDPESTWRSWRGADVLAPVPEQRDAARAWWHLGYRARIIAEAIGEVKGVPFVVTCGGFVVMGADIIGLDEELDEEGEALTEGTATCRPRMAA